MVTEGPDLLVGISASEAFGLGDDGMDAHNEPAVAGAVDCGRGGDVVYTDGVDVIAGGCEEALPGPASDPDELLPYALPALYRASRTSRIE